MPCTARDSAGNYCCHVPNRGNARQAVFHTPDDHAAFLRPMVEADDRDSLRFTFVHRA